MAGNLGEDMSTADVSWQEEVLFDNGGVHLGITGDGRGTFWVRPEAGRLRWFVDGTPGDLFDAQMSSRSGSPYVLGPNGHQFAMICRRGASYFVLTENGEGPE